MPVRMLTHKPSLAARAITQLVETWPIYSHGEYISGNLSIAGFNIVDNGCFASVVEGKPGQVIKVFSLQDIGYQHLLSYALKASSEHLPKLFSYTKSGQYGIVELERLAHKAKEAVALSNYIDRCHNDPEKVKHRWGSDLKDLILQINYSIDLHNCNNDNQLSWDCHENNILFREKVPVLVDIVFGEIKR